MGSDARGRRTPLWIRELTTKELHALCGRFLREQLNTDLSDRQWWLWDTCQKELEWRFCHPSPKWNWCTCSLCFVDRFDESYVELVDDDY